MPNPKVFTLSFLLSALSFLLLISLFTLSNATAASDQTYHLKLLAVQESPSGEYVGSDADLYLELRPGTGRVFLDTSPLTKIDTQVSTRFAKEIACAHYHLNCSKYDFIYTIKAHSNIVGGPSAGAAMAALTAVAVMNLPYDESVAVTGTINSGATIGPVGGLKQKIEAASSAGLSKVLLPVGTATQKETLPEISDGAINDSSTNVTIINVTIPPVLDLKVYGKQKFHLEVVEVSNLDDVLLHLTGQKISSPVSKIVSNTNYDDIMQKLQQVLCLRTTKIIAEFNSSKIVPRTQTRQEVEERNLQFEKAITAKNYYSAASFCFANNIALKTDYYSQMQLKIDSLNTRFANLERNTLELQEQVSEQKIKTISDLQTKMIVTERIADVFQQIDDFNQQKGAVQLSQLHSMLAYAEERYYSAAVWMQFFSMPGQELSISSAELNAACTEKTLEAQERVQYAAIYVGDDFLAATNEKITKAQAASEQKEYELCLIYSSMAKAEANAIISSIGVGEDTFSDFIASKIAAVKRVIAENSAEDTFPILGYSYYQYADALKDKEKYAALIYAEYALEMSDLRMYFPEKDSASQKSTFYITDRWVALIEGVIIGVLAAVLVLFSLNMWGKKPLTNLENAAVTRSKIRSKSSSKVSSKSTSHRAKK